MEKELDHLLVLEVYYWKQRSRAEWLANGDMNAKFFHHKAFTRRRNNCIKGFLSSANERQTDDKEVKSIFMQYFTSIFTTFNPSINSMENALIGFDVQITAIMRIQLDSPYSCAKVHRALFGMVPWKAPGLDGQQDWNLVGEHITFFVFEDP